MPGFPVLELFKRFERVFQDYGNVRFQPDELLAWAEDAQREVRIYKPECCVANLDVDLLAGNARQSLPAESAGLVDIVCNVASGRPVRRIDREMLDAQVPRWYASEPAAEIAHFVYDLRDPLHFYVYPRPQGVVAVQMIVNAVPAALTVDGDLGIAEIYANAVLDYMLYRACLKHAEYAANPARAAAHYSAFANALGLKLKLDTVRQPMPVGMTGGRGG